MMIRGLNFIYTGGLIVFLGSVFTFILVSNLIEGASLVNLSFGREIINTGTNILTLPGMWVFAIAGTLASYKSSGLSHKNFLITAILAILIVLNAHLFISPSVTLATEIAIESLKNGSLLPEYEAAYIKESAFGAANVLLTISLVIVRTWNIGVIK